MSFVAFPPQKEAIRNASLRDIHHHPRRTHEKLHTFYNTMKQPSLLVVTWAVSTCLFITFTREGLTTSVQGATLRGDQAEEEHGSNEEIIQQHTALSESIARRNVHEEGEHDSSSLGPPDCLTPPRDAADMFAAVEHEKMYLSRGQQQRFTSPTYFNVIYHVFTTTDHQGEVPDGVFSKAISILNKAYSGAEVTPGGGAGFTYTNTNIRFRLQGIQRYLDDNLALNCGDMDVVDSAIRTGYRIVGINAINVYVCKLSSACGYAYYPCGSDSQQVFQSWDCLVRSPEFGWLPPSGQTCKDKGDTMVHEFGRTVNRFFQRKTARCTVLTNMNNYLQYRATDTFGLAHVCIFLVSFHTTTRTQLTHARHAMICKYRRLNWAALHLETRWMIPPMKVLARQDYAVIIWVVTRAWICLVPILTTTSWITHASSFIITLFLFPHTITTIPY